MRAPPSSRSNTVHIRSDGHALSPGKTLQAADARLATASSVLPKSNMSTPVRFSAVRLVNTSGVSWTASSGKYGTVALLLATETVSAAGATVDTLASVGST